MASIEWNDLNNQLKLIFLIVYDSGRNWMSGKSPSSWTDDNGSKLYMVKYIYLNINMQHFVISPLCIICQQLLTLYYILYSYRWKPRFFLSYSLYIQCFLARKCMYNIHKLNKDAFNNIKMVIFMRWDISLFYCPYTLVVRCGRVWVQSPDAKFLYDQWTLSRMSNVYIYPLKLEFLNPGPTDQQLDALTH